MTNNFEACPDNKFYYLHWPSNTETKAIVLLVHGLGEHCERYAGLADYLNAAGYALCSMDLPGHGQSVGRRGHIDRFHDYEVAVKCLHDKIKTLYPNHEIFLLGHSMGGLIATHFLLGNQQLFKGAMLSGAAIQSPQQPPELQLKIVRLISRIFPRLGVMKLDASQVSKDTRVVANYMGDPLVNRGKLSARLLSEMFTTMNECIDQAAKISLPILIMHGDADVMTSPEGSRLLHEKVSSQDKSLKIYSGLYHEIFNEPEKLEVYADVVRWLDDHSV